MSFLEVKAHSRRKHSILRKYLEVCKIFSDKYQNFAYVDTHGGTGQVIDFDTKKTSDGSVLVAARLQPSFSCYVIEIDFDNYKLLQQSTKGYPNVNLFPGDCNQKIDDALSMIPKGRKFVFCFLDPDSLMYGAYDQLKWETVEKIAKFPRTEVLINVPTFTIMRCAGVVKDYPEASSSIKIASHLTNFYGSDKWKALEPGDYRGLARLYVSERLTDYEYKGAILMRSVLTRGPLYYLVYGSNSGRGGEIMRDIMKKEWIDITKGYPVTRYQYRTDQEWLNAEYPITLFVFED
jgi:three-Cys-motif partner protein